MTRKKPKRKPRRISVVLCNVKGTKTRLWWLPLMAAWKDRAYAVAYAHRQNTEFPGLEARVVTFEEVLR